MVSVFPPKLEQMVVSMLLLTLSPASVRYILKELSFHSLRNATLNENIDKYDCVSGSGDRTSTTNQPNVV